MGSKKVHAERNRDLAEKLFTEGVYFDWCITTCFYSAIQYVHLKALPGSFNGELCDSIDKVAYALKISDKSKHYITEQIVKDKIPSLKVEYRWLKDSSFNARYMDYEVNPENAKLAKKFLKKIINICDPA